MEGFQNLGRDPLVVISYIGFQDLKSLRSSYVSHEKGNSTMDCMAHTSIRTNDAISILHRSVHLGRGLFDWPNLLHDECMSHV